MRRLSGKNKRTLSVVFRHRVVGLLIFLLSYAQQSKEFTGDEATNSAGSLPKGTAALEKSGSSFRRSAEQSTKCLTASFKKAKIGSYTAGVLAQIQKCGCFGNKSKADMKCHTQPFKPFLFPSLSKPQISSNVLSKSQQLGREACLHMNSTTKKGFFIAVLFC